MERLATPSDFYVPSRGNAAARLRIVCEPQHPLGDLAWAVRVSAALKTRLMPMDRFVYGALTLSVYAFVAFLVVV
ncbi:MAG: hypothetical protein AB7I52_06420 [Rhizobiaceae bacterium]